ncbi:MAG: phospholipid carrier-dependent glycosyltransferase, partial [Vulcanimicrobiota bacterium]
MARKKNNKKEEVAQLPEPDIRKKKHRVMDKKDALILLVIVLFSLALRVYGLSFPKDMNFDEVHYVPAARSYLDPTEIDPNYIHPPLAKEIMAVFMAIYGDNPIGWRMGSVFLGTIMIIFMYLFGIEMFKSRFAAIVCSVLLSVEFLHIVQSRIATLDIYLAFFILIGYFYAWMYIDKTKNDPVTGIKIRQLKYLVYCAIFFGGAIAVKLNGLAGAGGAFLFIAIALTREQGKIPFKQLVKIFFIALAVISGVYFITHIPFLLKDGDPAKMFYIRTFQFHYNEEFTHPYLSQMWQWPTVHRPIWYLWDKNKETGIIRGVVAIGNLLFWWSFIPILLDMIYRAFKEKDLKVIFILCGYLPLYLFWLSSLSSYGGGWHLKGGFFYYMLPCVPFMAMGVAETLEELRDSKIGRISIAVYFAGLAIFLVAFYPILAGIPI